MQQEKNIILSNIYPVAAHEFATAGEVSGIIKQSLKKLGIPDPIIRRIAIASYEAEMNIVIHTYGGELILEVTPEYVQLASKDIGPGIPNIEMAMSEGYSTASDEIREMGFGAGMGLSNMKRCSDEFLIDSKAGKATTIHMKFYL